jgi:hypothetical protein
MPNKRQPRKPGQKDVSWQAKVDRQSRRAERAAKRAERRAEKRERRMERP